MCLCIIQSSVPIIPYVPLRFFCSIPIFLLLFTFHAHIYGHIAMDLVRSVRFHEIKSSCCRYCICVKAFYSMLVLYVFAWNRSNSNRVVFYGITLSICYTLSLLSWSVCALILFLLEPWWLFYLLLFFHFFKFDAIERFSMAFHAY